uniref:CULT domain-containing protein n=2 Tax=Parascaris univalens TaxID=6257 RepID=A0A915ATE0_PARUN
ADGCAMELLLLWYLLWMCLTAIAGRAALLCRRCGHTVAHGSMLTNKKSSFALRRYNMSVLGRNQLVQVFENPLRETFDVVTALTADLQLSGKAQVHATWFPEHEWTICVCSVCGTHLGWYFQPENIQVKSAKSFVGLVLGNLISDDYADTLTRVP